MTRGRDAMQAFHRHIRSQESFCDHVNRLIRDEPEKYEYCDLCGCVPTNLIARTPLGARAV